MTGNQIYRFGDFRLDPVARALYESGRVVHMAPKACDLLLHFVEHPGKVITKDELAEHIWPGLSVADDNISQHVFLARKALGDLERPHRYIRTVHRQGFRFVAQVTSSSGYVKAALEYDFGDLERFNAQHLYRSGRYFLNTRTQAGNDSAVDLLTRALEAYPALPEAHAALAEAHWFAAHSYYVNARDAIAAADRHVREALRLDPKCASALLVWAALDFFFRGDSQAALDHLTDAAAAGTTSLHLPVLQIQMTAARGDRERAIRLALDALNAHPQSTEISAQLGMALYLARDFESAAKHLAGVLVLDPSVSFARYYLGMSQFMKGNVDEARRQLAKAAQPPLAPMPQLLWPVEQPAAGALTLLETQFGDRECAIPLRSSFARALSLASRRRRAECRAALAEAVAQQDPWVVFLAADPVFDDVRGDSAAA